MEITGPPDSGFCTTDCLVQCLLTLGVMFAIWWIVSLCNKGPTVRSVRKGVRSFGRVRSHGELRRHPSRREATDSPKKQTLASP